MSAKLTSSQKKALEWLAGRNGDGVFDKHGVLIAAGETAPFTRHTWNGLRDAGLLEFYQLAPNSRGYGRARLTERARTT